MLLNDGVMPKVFRILKGRATHQQLKVLTEPKGGNLPQLLRLPSEGLDQASEAQTNAPYAARLRRGGGCEAFAEAWKTTGDVSVEVLRTHVREAVGHHRQYCPVLGHRDKVVVTHHHLQGCDWYKHGVISGVPKTS